MKTSKANEKMAQARYKKGENHFLSGFMLGLSALTFLSSSYYTPKPYGDGFRRDAQNLSEDGRKSVERLLNGKSKNVSK